jgi:hypothetical protein
LSAARFQRAAITAAFMTVLLFVAAVPATAQETAPAVDPLGMTVETRFRPPAGYERQAQPDDSFASYLRQLPLKPDGAQVKLYDGRIKPDRGIYAAVVDLPIGHRDLHQCADAVIRLRAEYLFAQKRYAEIRFGFSSGFTAEYSRWRRGERIVISGNSARWVPTGRPGDGPRSFWRFLEVVFSYAGTSSLSRELLGVPGDNPEIGDVFIQGGHPGHAVIVVDKAADKMNGRRIFLLAQSYMPAQELQVLRNPNNGRLSPWYEAGFGETLVTPQWIFGAADLKQWLP